MKSHIYSVSQINRYIKNLIEKDIFLRDIFIEAEISNFKVHTSGHFYFTLKDEFAAINTVMYKSYSRDIKFLPENGMKVTVYGYISIYEKTGQYQLCVKIMEPTGKGALYAAFEQLKNKLEKEGLFDIGRKRRIPRFPRKIAVLTSPVGAAIRDIIRISERRNPNIKIIVVPVIVQGESAAKSICDGLSLINRYKDADVIILGRGGGSIED
ncbi:MAG: exodeoxyribonuclease VII large subunit, partial [Clostridiales bacterium]|nr:exodeoxyribonuclease VII large subunit [Clostridiales bacterium]